jgi:hypothetical protein
MNGRKLSLSVLVVLCGFCLIVPPNVFGENPFDPDRPTDGGIRNIVIVDSTDSDTTIVDTSLVSGTTSPPGTTVQPQVSQESKAPSWMPNWLREFYVFSGLHLWF